MAEAQRRIGFETMNISRTYCIRSGKRQIRWKIKEYDDHGHLMSITYEWRDEQCTTR